MSSWSDIQGYHVNAKKDYGNSGYDTLCSDCAYKMHDDDTLDNHSMPIFTHSESDSIQCCEWCGELIRHALTGDGDKNNQYTSRYAVDVGYRNGWEVNFYTYENMGMYRPTRSYKNVTPASIARVMRWMFNRGMSNGFFNYGHLQRSGIYYTILGWERID